MNNIKCPNCGYENSNTNIKCVNCGTELNHLYPGGIILSDKQVNEETIDNTAKKTKSIFSGLIVLCLLPFFIVAIIFIIISMFFNVSDYNSSKNYLKTEGTLVDTVDCFYSDDIEYCKGVYEYTVDGKVYRGSPNVNSNHFSKKVTVRYNPDNPSDCVISGGFNSLLICGIVMVVVIILIIIFVRKKVNNRVNSLADEQKEVLNSKSL